MNLRRFPHYFISKFTKTITEMTKIRFGRVLQPSHHQDAAHCVVPFEILVADSIEADLSRGEVVLNEEFFANPTEWDRHLGPLFKSQLHNVIEKILISEKKSLWIIIHLDRLDVDLINQTLSALDRIDAAKDILLHRVILSEIQSNKIGAVIRAMGRTEEKYLFGKSRSNLLKRIPPNDFILWAKIGDAPRPEFSTSMMLYAISPTKLITFDTYFYDENRVYPVYMPGKNTAYILNSDCIFSRFVVLADVIQNYGGDNDAIPLIEIVRRWIEAASNWHLIREWTHIPLPIYHLNSSPQR